MKSTSTARYALHASCMLAFVLLVSVFVLPRSAFADVSFSFYPQASTVRAGSLISVGVFLTADQSVNGMGGVLSFSPDTLEVVSLDTAGSIADLWVEHPSYANDTGVIKFGGVTFNPGFKGKLGKVITIRFRTKAEGRAAIRFVSDSVLANDGHGTELTVTGAPMAIVDVGSASAPKPISKEASAIDTSDVFPPHVIDSTPGSATSVAQIFGMLIVLAALSVALFNLYSIRSLAKRIPLAKALTEEDAALLRQLKKDVEKAEDALAKRVPDES